MRRTQNVSRWHNVVLFTYWYVREMLKFIVTLATDNSAFMHHETTTFTHPVSVNYPLQAIVAP